MCLRGCSNFDDLWQAERQANHEWFIREIAKAYPRVKAKPKPAVKPKPAPIYFSWEIRPVEKKKKAKSKRTRKS
jgi:hypothetical protein